MRIWKVKVRAEENNAVMGTYLGLAQKAHQAGRLASRRAKEQNIEKDQYVAEIELLGELDFNAGDAG